MKKAILGVIAACVLAAIGVFLGWLESPNRTILRNSSGAEITNVSLSVHSLDGAVTVSREVKRIGPDESLVLRHGLNDPRVKVSFRLRGKGHEYAENYVDLWTGEGWVLDVFPDGSIHSGYQSTSERSSSWPTPESEGEDAAG